MNPSFRSEMQSPTPWFRVAEVWLVLLLLTGAVVGSFVLLAAALNHPDVHLVVPNAVRQPASMPPMAPARAMPATPAVPEAPPR